MIHIYTGNGKGKTTAAFGLAIRAAGQGLRVIIFQFLKPKKLLSGEEKLLRRLEGIKLVKFNETHPMFKACNKKGATHEELLSIERDLMAANKAILSQRYDMVILDEVINLVDQRFVKRESLAGLLKAVPKDIELVLTGRGNISDIEQYADYITVMMDKKHPFKKCAKARKGIEY